MSEKKLCRGTVKSTGKPCTARRCDINGFCGNHYKQSVEYAKAHPWTVIWQKDEYGRETCIKVDRIIPGYSHTSESFR